MGIFRNDVTLSDQQSFAWNKLNDAEKDDADLRMAVYAAMIDCLDQNIGRLLSKLDSTGKRDNTIIFFASDNGGSAVAVERGDGPIGSITRWTSLKRDWANV
ncbi:MAG: sulfatase-like hydrolase/transferase, partial [Verrucomicrobiales bacterium]|nr:sulfatase-like hydrolase/transferase [Verrucomicrobiales bacterium]